MVRVLNLTHSLTSVALRAEGGAARGEWRCGPQQLAHGVVARAGDEGRGAVAGGDGTRVVEQRDLPRREVAGGAVCVVLVERLVAVPAVQRAYSSQYSRRGRIIITPPPCILLWRITMDLYRVERE
jgi:hypothetical protein